MQAIERRKLRRFGNRLFRLLLCGIFIIQTFGFPSVAHASSAVGFQGYDHENISSGTFTYGSSGASVDGTTVSFTAESGQAIGYIALNEGEDDISTAIDLGGLEIDFSTVATTTLETGSSEESLEVDVATAEIKFFGDSNDLLGTVSLHKSNPAEAGSETLRSHASIPVGTRELYIYLYGTSVSGSNTVVFSDTSLIIPDSSAPSCSIDYNEDWTNQPITVCISASDSDSGLKGIYLNDNPVSETSPYEMVVSENGTTLSAYSMDNAGKKSDVQTKIISNIDTTTPAEPASLSLSATDWTNEDVSLNPPDLPASTGAPEKYVYQIGASAWNDLPGGFVISTSGTTTIRVAVADEAGNRSGYLQATAKIDKLAPVIDTWQSTASSGSCRVDLTYHDEGLSGLKGAYYAEGTQDADYFTTGGTAILDGTFTVSIGGDYTICILDNAGNATLKTVTLSTAPRLGELENKTIDEDELLEIPLVVSDAESLLTTLSISATTDDTKLLPTIQVNRSETAASIVIKPGENLYGGPATVTVVVTDPNEESVRDSFTVTVLSVNDAPTATEDSGISLNEDTFVEIDVLENDSDNADSDTLSIDSCSAAKHGTTLVVLGKIRYTPNSDYVGEDSFSYTVSDGNGGTATAIVRVTVLNVNDAPVALDDEASVAEDGSISIPVMYNDSDIDFSVDIDPDETVTISEMTSGTNGTTELDGSAIVYRPAKDFFGQDSFTYTITDHDGSSAKATVTVTVSPVADAPVYVDLNDSYTINEDTSANEIVFSISDVETPPDSLMLQAASTTTTKIAQSGISISGLGDNLDEVKLLITPVANQNGDATILLSLGDGFVTVQRSITIHIQDVNDAPRVATDTVTFVEGTGEVEISIAGLLTNDSDIDKDTLSFGPASDLTQPSSGEIRLRDENTLIYTPEADFDGETSFTYSVSDGKDKTTATCRLVATGINDAPTIAFDYDSAEATEDTLSGAIPFRISDKETSVEDLVLIASSGDTSLVAPDGIHITNNGDGSGSLAIQPQADANGPLTITLTVSDGEAQSSDTISLTIAPAEDAPVGENDEVYVRYSSAYTFSVLDNDHDIDGDELRVIPPTTTDLLGALTFDSTTQQFTYAPAVGENDNPTFTYTVTDESNEDTATVTMHVVSVTHDPVISPINSKYVLEDGTTSEIPFTVSDEDVGDTFEISVASGEESKLVADDSHAVVRSLGAGKYTLTLTPVADSSGLVTVTVTAKDKAENSDSTTFTLHILAQNDAPVAVHDTVQLDEDNSAELDLLDKDYDADKDSIWVTSVSKPANGYLTRSGNVITYTPYAQWYGTESLTYYISDGRASSHATVDITVRSVNDAPVAWNDYVALPNESGQTAEAINVLGNDRDPEGDTVYFYKIESQPTYGTVEINPDGTILYKRNAVSRNPNGADSFTYSIIDRENDLVTDALTATATVYIGVEFHSSLYTYGTTVHCNEDCDPFEINLDVSNPNLTDYTLTINTPCTLGTLSVVSDKTDTVLFKPTANAYGYQEITYTVANAANTEHDTGIICLTVYPVNDVPIIDEAPASVTTEEDAATPASFDVTFHDIDCDLSDLHFYVYTASASTSLPIVFQTEYTTKDIANGKTVTVKPLANVNGSAVIVVGVSDGFSYVQQTIDLTVTPQDDAPVLVDINRTIWEDASVRFAALPSDYELDGDETTVSIDQPSNGTATLCTDNTILYTPKANFNGTDTFHITVTDETTNAKSSTALVTITVLPVNDQPVISGISYYQTTAEDTPKLITLTVSDVDNDMTNSGSYTFQSGDESVVLSDDIVISHTSGNGMLITVNPVENASGTTLIRMIATDGTLTANAAFLLNVTPVNDEPIAVDDKLTVNETVYDGSSASTKTTAVMDLTANDTDVEGGTLRIIAITNVQNGTVVNTGGGSVTVSADGDRIDDVTFQYTVMDPGGETASASAKLIITPKNDPPHAGDDSTIINEDETTTIEVLTNDSDPEGEALTVTAVSTAGHGQASFNDSTVSYVPAKDYNGKDSFTYTVKDASGATATATVSVTIRPINDAPVIAKYPAESGEWTMLEDTPKDFHFDVSDAESADSNLIIRISSEDETRIKTSQIQLSTNEAGYKTIYVVPNTNANGTVYLDFSVSDGLETTTVKYPITIKSVNDAPVVTPMYLLVEEDTPFDAVATATDADDNELQFSIVTGYEPIHGTVVLHENGSFTYTPNEDYNGIDLFEIAANDNQEENSIGTAFITVRVLPKNDPPTAKDDAVTILEDTPREIDVLYNDVDEDLVYGDDKLTILLISSAPAKGTAAISEGKVLYTPSLNQNGTDSFTYVIADQDGKIDSADVTVTITPVNDAPENGNDVATTNEDTAISISVLENDDVDEITNPNLENLTIKSVSKPANGTAWINSGGLGITYTPDANYFNEGGDPDVFTYTVYDSGLPAQEATFSVFVTVKPVNDAPTITADVVGGLFADVTMDEDTDSGAISFTVFDEEDAKDDLTVTVTHNNSVLLPEITATPNADGKCSFTINSEEDKVGTATITVKVTDSGALSAQKTFTVTVNPVNDLPTPKNDAYSVAEAGTITKNVLENDDVDLDTGNGGDSLKLLGFVTSGDGTATTLNTAFGTATVVDNKLVYTHTATTADKGIYTDSFQYRMKETNDTSGTTYTATVTVSITPYNDAPEISDITDRTEILEDAENGTGEISFTVEDEEDDDDGLRIIWETSNATLVPLSNIIITNPDSTTDSSGSQRTVKIIPALDQFGSATITLTVRDTEGRTATDTFAVTVTAVNDTPREGHDKVSVNEDTSITISVLTNDDVDLNTNPTTEALTITGVTKPENGETAISTDKKKITYTPKENYFSPTGMPDTFNYSVIDAANQTATFTVSVTVLPVNDAPTIDYRGIDDLAASKYTVKEGVAVNGILFYVNDVDHNTDLFEGTSDVTVTAKSNNSILLAANGITLTSGAHNDRYISLQPNGEWNGTAKITISATDKDGAKATPFVFTLEVTNVNMPPVAVADNLSVPEDAVTNVEVLKNDTDPDLITNPSTEIVYVNSVSTTSTYASVSVSDDCKSVVVTPIGNFNGSFTFTYTIRDVEGVVSDPVTSTVTVTQVNDPPAPENDAVEMDEDGAVPIAVLDNDKDTDQTEGINLTPGAEVLSASIQAADLRDPAHGTISISSDVITYTPNANFNGTDTFEYNCFDGEANTKATVTVTVKQVNDAPVAIEDVSEVDEDHSVSKDVVENDTDVDAEADKNLAAGALQQLSDLTLTDASVDPEKGTVSRSGNTITFTPALNTFGQAIVTYTVLDKDNATATGTYKINVKSVNDLPLFTTAPADMNLREDIDTGSSAIVVSDVETAVGALKVTFAGSTNTALADENCVTFSSGTDGNWTVQVDPKLNQNGTAKITLRVTDGDKGYCEKTFTVTVAAVNDDPTAEGKQVTTPEDTATTIDVASLIGDVDIATNKDVITVSIAADDGPTNGGYTLSGTQITYTPTANYNGADSITYTVTDQAGKTASAKISLTVTQVNDPPAPENDAVEMDEDGAVPIAVLDNDKDTDQTKEINLTPGAEVLSASIQAADLRDPAHGTISISSDVITYTPNANFNGTDTFEYNCFDGEANTKATVTVTVKQVNDAPTAKPDTTTTDEDTQVTYNVLDNDQDVDTDDSLNLATPLNKKSEFSITKIDLVNETNGTISFSGGSITYEPSDNFVGTQVISYEMRDGHGGSSSSTLSVIVGSENDAPVAANDVIATTEDHAATINVLENDLDYDKEDTLHFAGFKDSVSSLPGTFSTNADGTITFTPKAEYHGSFTVDYYVSDSTNLTDNGTISISVSAVNDIPVALDTEATTPEDTAATIDVASLISDVDVATDADTIVVSIAADDGPTNGGYTLSGTQIVYTPKADFNGKDSIVYTVTDSFGKSDTGTIALSITAVNDKPVVVGNSAKTDEDTLVTINVLGNDSDVDTDDKLNAKPDAAVTIASVGAAAHGTTRIVGGQITYLPDKDFNGTDSFTYTVSDGILSETGSVSVQISQVNDKIEVIEDETSTTDEDPVEIDVLKNDNDVDIDAGNNLDVLHNRTDFTIVSVGTAGNGTTEIVNGKIVYTPNDRFAGKDSFTYKATDGHGTNGTATVQVTVVSVNDAPKIIEVGKPVDGTKAIPPDPIPVAWTAFDIDGDALTYSLEYFDGKNWLLAASDLTKAEYAFAVPATLASTSGLKFRVTANDGVLTSVYGYSGAVKVDKDAPTGSVVSLRTADGRAYTAGTWTNQTVYVQASGAADASSVAYYYSMDGAAEAAGENMSVTSGVHTVYVTARDEFKNQTALGGYIARVDKQVPAVPQMRNSISGGNVVVSFTLQTDPGGSGNDYLVLPDGSTLNAGGTLQFATAKNGTYSFTLVDIAGNRRTFSYTVESADTTKPLISCTSGAYRIGTSTKDDISATLTFTDNESAIVTRGYQLSTSSAAGSAYRSYSGAIPMSDAGTYYIHAFAKNAFGASTYETFGPFILEDEAAAGAGVTPTPEPTKGSVVVTKEDIEEIPGETVAVRLPGKEWSETLTLEDVSPGDYLVEVMDADGNVRTVTVHVTAQDIFARSLKGADSSAAIVALALAAAAGLLLLLLFAGFNVIVTVVNVPFAEEKKIRAMRRIMFARKEFIIKLEQGHIQGGKFARIKIAKHLTKKLRGSWIIVQIQGVEVLREQIPEDLNEPYRRKITLE